MGLLPTVSKKRETVEKKGEKWKKKKKKREKKNLGKHCWREMIHS